MQHAIGGSHVCQRENLAQHTLVHSLGELHQMTVTQVLHAGCTLHLIEPLYPMNVERRQEKHRQIDCQQHPRSNMSFCYRIHKCKSTVFILNKAIFWRKFKNFLPIRRATLVIASALISINNLVSSVIDLITLVTWLISP